MRLLLIVCAVAVSRAEQSPAERLIEAGHWKRARTLVETRLREAPAVTDRRDLQALRDLMEFYLLAPGLIGGDPHKAVEVASRIGEIDVVEGLLGRARIAEFHSQVAARGGL